MVIVPSVRIALAAQPIAASALLFVGMEPVTEKKTARHALSIAVSVQPTVATVSATVRKPRSCAPRIAATTLSLSAATTSGSKVRIRRTARPIATGRGKNVATISVSLARTLITVPMIALARDQSVAMAIVSRAKTP